MTATITSRTTMHAVRVHEFGGPDVLRFETVPTPGPKPGQILVRVHAAGVNPVDWKIREGLIGQDPLPQVMGSDFSGVIKAVGPEVEHFHVGQSVFGTVVDESGSYAEFALTHSAQIAIKPDALDYIQAAALPIASMTAWQALFDEAGLEAGQKVLIHAAAGGVGSFAVQFARWKKAHVIGTASEQSIDFVKQLGADEVIDYRASRFEDQLKDVDVVFDTVGGQTQDRSWKVLKSGGILVSIVKPPSGQFARKAAARGVFLRSDHKRGDELAKIAELVIQGTVKVHIEQVLPLSEARKAQELSQNGHAHGKIVLLARED